MKIIYTSYEFNDLLIDITNVVVDGTTPELEEHVFDSLEKESRFILIQIVAAMRQKNSISGEKES